MAITVLFILLGSFASGSLSVWEPFLVLGMMLMLGLPHGATDHGLFLALRANDQGVKKVKFYTVYLAFILAYGFIWWMLPILAFTIFMLLSVYHFGQSNWVKVYSKKETTLARMHYLLWGSGVLLTPILLHVDEAVEIVTSMTAAGILSMPPPWLIYGLIGTLAIANVIVILVLRLTQRITNKSFLLELLGYGLLMAMFFTNSLLLGFSIYFVFWHSLSSAKDQLKFFKLRLSPALRRQLYGEIAMTVLGALVFCGYVWFGPGPATALQPAVIGGVFIFISLLTLPHMLLVELLYARWSPTASEIPLEETENIHQVTRITHVSDLTATAGRKEITITH